MATPRYAHIEFCRNEETLFGKLKSGRWEWLGVHPGAVRSRKPASRELDGAAAGNGSSGFGSCQATRRGSR